MTYHQRAKDLYTMIERGKLIDAIEKYYHENVLIISDDGKERKGKSEARKYDEYFLKEIEEVFGGEILNVTSDEDKKITMVEFWINVKFKNGVKKQIKEVAVQNWDGDLIMKENFYSRK